MPEYAALTVGKSGVPGRFNGFFNGKILVVARQYFHGLFSVIGKTDKVFKNIQQALFLEQPLEKGVKLGEPGIFITAVYRFPFHETVFSGGDGSGLGSHLVAHHANGVVNKHGGDFLHVIAELPVGFGSVRLFPGRRFQLNKHDRQTVQEQNHVRPLAAVFHECPLIGHNKGIIVRIIVIRQVDNIGTHFALVAVLYGNSVLKIVHKHGIPLYKLSIINIF